MKKIKHLYIFFAFLISTLFFSCSNDNQKIKNIDYCFTVAKNSESNIEKDFTKVEFTSNNNLDLGFYKGKVWIKLDISNGNTPESFIVLCNDFINHNYRFYKQNNENNSFITLNRNVNFEKYDDRTFSFAKPNFRIDLNAHEKATFIISTSSDGRIIQATPKLIRLDEFLEIKQQTLLFDILFYSFILLLLLINVFYFRLVKSGIYYYYGAYIISGCLMYLFVEGRLYGLGWSNVLVDHMMFLFIRIWILSSLLFTLKFLDTKITNPKYYKFIIITLYVTLGGTTIYQLVFYSFSISTLHKFENIIGFIWILLSLITVGKAYKKRKTQSIYYLISYSIFLLFVSLGLMDSHTTILPGDPFSYFKIGTILEFIVFTYFITILVKQKLSMNEKLEKELLENRSMLQEKEKLLASNTNLVSIFKLIENSFSNDSDWDDFKERFKTINPKFITLLLQEHPDISKSEIRLLTLIHIGYSQKEIASILNIAPDSVKKARSRVRKKLNLDNKQDLNHHLKAF